MIILMSHYNRSSKKTQLFLVLLNILTHFSFKTEINVPLDLQNSIPAPLKSDLKMLYFRNIATPTVYS